MHYKYLVFRLTALIMFLSLANSAFAIKPFKEVNTPNDEKAVSFYNSFYFGSEVVGAWVTNSSGCNNNQSKKIQNINCLGPDGRQGNILNLLNQNQSDKDKIYFDGVPSFAACNIYCSDKTGAFASNRLVEGKYYSNDIYEILYKVNDPYAIKRIDEINTQYWEDSPALTPDGKTMFFVSDRNRPGSGYSDLFYSFKTDSGWSTPVALDSLNTNEFSEESPYVDPLGKYLYYASDENGDYDIWRVELDANSIPAGKGRLLEEELFPYVNLKGSNEFAPCFSTGGHFFVFASNRITEIDANKTKDYDIYWHRMDNEFFEYSSGNEIEISVESRSQKFDEAKDKIVAIAEPCMTSVFYEDLTLKNRQIIQTNQDGICFINLLPETINSPCIDNRVRKITLSTNCACIGSSQKRGKTDTLVFDTYCKEKKKYTLSCYEGYKPPDTVYFPVKTIPFFVEGYWCPTTNEYSELTNCNTVFTLIEKCPEIEPVETEVTCQNNEVFNYRLDQPKYQPKVLRSRNPKSYCIQYDEFTGDELEKYSGYVDEEIEKIVGEMKKVFASPYIKEAIYKGNTIRIEVIGWTDPLKVGDCDYTGETIDFNTSFITLDPIYMGSQKAYIKDGKIEHNTPFAISPQGGNLLLSDLRAYYTAYLLDILWQEIPEYKSLREKEAIRRIEEGDDGKKLIDVVAVGNSVRRIPNLSNAAKRSVDVQLMVMNKDKETEKKETEPIGVSIRICYPPCDCDEE